MRENTEGFFCLKVFNMSGVKDNIVIPKYFLPKACDLPDPKKNSV